MDKDAENAFRTSLLQSIQRVMGVLSAGQEFGSANSRVVFIDNGRHGDVVLAQLGGVNQEVVHEVVLGRNADVSGIRVAQQLVLLRIGERQPDGQIVRQVVEDGYFDLQLLGPLSGVGQVQFQEEGLERLDTGARAHAESVRL